MTVNDVFEVEATGVADAGDFTVDGSSAETGAAEVFEFGGTVAADVYREIDIDGDGTFEVSVKVDSLSGVWHSQLNQLVVSQSQNTRLRINNISGGSGDFYAVGVEVND